MRFYLGTHDPYWLWRDDLAAHTGGTLPPLFISRRRLERLRNLRPSPVPWAIDSGGFTELHTYGGWRTSAAVYVAEVARYADEIGNLDFAAAMDWMVEPSARDATGQSVDRHQQRTVASYLELRHARADLPWAPVLQGFTDTPGAHPADAYLRCLERYDRAGVAIDDAAVWGIGSMCRRESTGDAVTIVATLARHGLAGRMHLFGVKTAGLAKLVCELDGVTCDASTVIASSDSMAWSLTARLAGADPSCPNGPHGRTGTGHCGNCIAYAGAWWRRVVDAVGTRPSPSPLPTVRPGVGAHRIGTPEPGMPLDVATRDRYAVGSGRPLPRWRSELLAGIAATAGLGPEAVATLDAELPARPSEIFAGAVRDGDEARRFDAACTRVLPAAAAALRRVCGPDDGWVTVDGRTVGPAG